MVGRKTKTDAPKVTKKNVSASGKASEIFLSVVIPAFNEERRLPATLRRVLSYLKKQSYSFEVVVVNDGSKDKTAEVAQSFKEVRLVDYLPNRGKGHAVRTGMFAAQGQHRLICDADLSTPIEELEKFLHFVVKPSFATEKQSNELACSLSSPTLPNQVMTGSRKLQESNVKLYQPLHRRLLGEFFSLLVKTLVVGGIQDTQCGFKLISAEASRRIFPLCTVNRWAWEPEVFYLAKKFGYGVREVPVVWVNDTESRVHPVRDSLRMLKDLMSTRWNIIRGKYVEQNCAEQRCNDKNPTEKKDSAGEQGGSCCDESS